MIIFEAYLRAHIIQIVDDNLLGRHNFSFQVIDLNITLGVKKTI